MRKAKNKQMRLLALLFSICLTVAWFPYISVSAIEEIKINDILTDDFYLNAELVAADHTGVTLKYEREQPVTRSGLSTTTIDTVKFVPNSQENAQELVDIVTPKATRANSNYRELPEKSGAGTLYSTITFTNTTINGKAYVVLNKAEGGYSQRDSTVTWVNNVITIGQSGLTTSGPYKNQSQTVTNTVTKVWAIGAPSNWLPVAAVDTSDVGCSMTTHCKRGSSTWFTVLDNFVY